ncbi:conserved Plasmodium protein, unknown function [Plasmodium malariae]|uniref:Uncharacterized protein n=1 Tax=Plasmodium malariae TaxID=5858 RepID=A0A1D3JML6_PLAMA|nr:conserved Plasmodium protein, unknown function [Plasmodium malariae]SBT87898.1 conserved Plasmodium protein, unknown function [Plasmodium malariae]
MSLLYMILDSTKNYSYMIFLLVDILLCIYIVFSLYCEKNAGIKISVEWMIYMITLSLKLTIFCFFIKEEKKNEMNSMFFTYLSNDVLAYNLIYITPFIYLLFSLRSRNILEDILNNKIIIENILSIDVNIINLFDLIDLTFMYSHVTSIYKSLPDSDSYYNFQKKKSFLMLIFVIVSMLLFGFYFPIYTNIEKTYTCDDDVDLYIQNEGASGKIKKKKEKKEEAEKREMQKGEVNGVANGIASYIPNGTSNTHRMNYEVKDYVKHAHDKESSTFDSNTVTLHDSTKLHSKMNVHSFNKSNGKTYRRDALNKIDDDKDEYLHGNLHGNLNGTVRMDVRNKASSSLESLDSKRWTYASSQITSNKLLDRKISSSSSLSSSHSCSTISSTTSSLASSSVPSSTYHCAYSSAPESFYAPSFTSFTSITTKNHNNKMKKSYHHKYKDVYTDVYITAKFHFIVGFLLIDIPFFVYRLLFCIKYKVLLSLIVKNILFLLFRSYKLNEYRLIEKEKYKKNKSNLDFHFYNILNFDSESTGYRKGENSENFKNSKCDKKEKKKKRKRKEKEKEKEHENENENEKKKALLSFGRRTISHSSEEHDLYLKRKYQNFFRVLKNKDSNDISNEKSKKELGLKKIKEKIKKKKTKRKKENEVLYIFKEEFKEYKKKIILERNSNGDSLLNNNLFLNNENEKSPHDERVNEENITHSSGWLNEDKRAKGNKTGIKLTWKERIRLRREYRKFVNLIYKLKYKREIPIYHFKIRDHISALCNFLFKKLNCSNFVYFDDKLIFSYITNFRFMFIILLDYFLKIGITVFFIFILLSHHVFVNDQNLIYMNNIPMKNSSDNVLSFPGSFDLTNYPDMILPPHTIDINYINRDTESVISSSTYNNNKNLTKGYIDIDLPNNIFKLKWEEIFIVDKIYFYACIAYFIMHFLIFIKTSTFFDILYVSIFNAISHLSFYFSLKQFILFFYTFNGNIYNKDYIYYKQNIRKLNYHFEYYYLILFNAHCFISILKHFSLFSRILFNFKYVYYYRNHRRAGESRKDELRYSVSVYILFLLCKYSYAPINLNILLFGKNTLSNILLIDNINSFTWVNILVIILFKSIQILITKANYFLIGLFILHIILYVIYAVHAQILRYIILRKIEILFSFKNILISKYEEIPLVPEKYSPYITCRDILKYYAEEGFFSSESNIIPNFI